MTEITLAVIAMAFLAPVMKPVVNILVSHHKIKQGDYLKSNNQVLQVVRIYHVASYNCHYSNTISVVIFEGLCDLYGIVLNTA